MDSAFKKDENCHPQVFLKEYRYTDKKGVRQKSDEEWIKAIKLMIF